MEGDRPGARLENDVVFLDAERGEYDVLRGTARRVWELLERPMTLDELSTRLSTEYDVPMSICEEQLTTFLAEMQRLHLIHSDSMG